MKMVRSRAVLLGGRETVRQAQMLIRSRTVLVGAQAYELQAQRPVRLERVDGAICDPTPNAHEARLVGTVFSLVSAGPGQPVIVEALSLDGLPWPGAVERAAFDVQGFPELLPSDHAPLDLEAADCGELEPLELEPVVVGLVSALPEDPEAIAQRLAIAGRRRSTR